MPLKTLLLNPPSFENFDGGASSRWPATREIESYWYPVWLAYPAGMLEGSKLLDAPPHHVSAEQTIEIAKDFEFLVLFTSTVGWAGDHGLARAIKKVNPTMKICFVGVENRSAEEIGDFKDQIYQTIDMRILDSHVFQCVNKRFVDAGLMQTRLRPDQLFLPANMRQFLTVMESQGQPFDYLLYATITSGTTQYPAWSSHARIASASL